MSLGSKMQASRYELKYLLDEPTALAIRDFVVRFLEPDQHTKPGTHGYEVHSLYLDSPDLRLCRATFQGEKNRFKLRVRFYDENPENPVFFEVKRRVNDVILKQRAAVWRSSVNDLVYSGWPRASDLVKDDAKNFRGIHNFCNLRNMVGARPAAYTSYLREAYEPPNSNEVRITFDRRLLAGPWTGELSIRDRFEWPRPYVEGVVLELKFTNRFPEWMHELVARFGLRRDSMAKYCKCVTVVEGSPLRHMGQLMPPELIGTRFVPV